MTIIHRALGAIAVMGLTIPFTACQDREVDMTIEHAKPRDANCQVSSSEFFLSHGSVDLAVVDVYRVDVNIRNNLVRIPDRQGFSVEDGRVNTTDIILQSAVIEYSSLDPLTANIAQKVNVALSGSIKVEDSVIIGLDLFSASMLEQFRSAPEFLLIDNGEARPKRTSVEVIARIRVKGETVDGRTVESNEFLFPVTVCNGCSVTYPALFLEQDGRSFDCPPVFEDDLERETLASSFVREDVCSATLGTNGVNVDCRLCQQIAVDPFARQLCQPPE
jgi:hypothetical protein